MSYLKQTLSLLVIITLQVSTTLAQAPWDIKIIEPEMISTEPGFSYGFLPINVANYFQLGQVGINLPSGKRAINRKLLDYKTMEVVDVVIPMDNFPKPHMATLNMEKTHNGQLLHYNGKVSSVRFRRTENYSNTGEFFCQYDHEKDEWSELVKLGPADSLRYFQHFGSDRANQFLYYAIGHRVDGGERMDEPKRFDISRIDLASRKIEKIRTLHMPERAYYLHFEHIKISPDGRWLVLSEYGDEAWRRAHPKDAEPIAYIIDTHKKTYKICKIPDTPYGHVITPDSRYLIFGSYETGAVVRIDILTGKRTHAIQSTTTIRDFHIAPSGNYFLVEYDKEKCPRKVVDVRSAHDLKLITSVLLDELFPDPDLDRDLISTMDGRVLISRAKSPSNSVKMAGRVLVHHLPENISPRKAGSPDTKKLDLTERIANGKLYATRHQIELSPEKYDLGNTTSLTTDQDQNVMITGRRWIGDMTSELVIAKLTRSGKKIWETKLPTKNGAISSAGLHIPASDGGCVVYFMYYPYESSPGQGRIARISGAGKVIYDTYFTARSEPNAPYMTDGMEMLSDGSVRIKGELYTTADEKTPWTGIVSREGVLSIR